MPDWYESTVSSHFLLEMGYLNGVAGRRFGQMVLLHQSPLDQLLGDAAGALDGKYFIIEFKRAESTLDTEWRKRLRRCLLGALSFAEGIPRTLKERARAGYTSPLDPIFHDALVSSGRGHFLCWGHSGEDQALYPCFAPYRCLLEAGPPVPLLTAVQDFLKQIGKPLAKGGTLGLDRGEFISYVSLMYALASNDEAEAGEEQDGEVDGSLGLLGCAAPGRGLFAVPFYGMSSLLRLIETSQTLLQPREISAQQSAAIDARVLDERDTNGDAARGSVRRSRRDSLS